MMAILLTTLFVCCLFALTLVCEALFYKEEQQL